MSNLSPEWIFSCQEHDASFNKDSLAGFSDRGTSDDTGSLRFIIVTGLWFDIFSCLSTDRLPQLPYRKWLGIQDLHMADLMGCENWVLVAIGDLAHLAKCKDVQGPGEVECTAELLVQGERISTDLENGIDKLEIATKVSSF